MGPPCDGLPSPPYWPRVRLRSHLPLPALAGKLPSTTPAFRPDGSVGRGGARWHRAGAHGHDAGRLGRLGGHNAPERAALPLWHSRAQCVLPAQSSSPPYLVVCLAARACCWRRCGGTKRAPTQAATARIRAHTTRHKRPALGVGARSVQFSSIATLSKKNCRRFPNGLALV